MSEFFFGELDFEAKVVIGVVILVFITSAVMCYIEGIRR